MVNQDFSEMKRRPRFVNEKDGRGEEQYEKHDLCDDQALKQSDYAKHLLIPSRPAYGGYRLHETEKVLSISSRESQCHLRESVTL